MNPAVTKPDPKFRRNYDVDKDAVLAMFKQYDTDGNGTINLEEFEQMLVQLGVAPKKTSQTSDEDAEKKKVHERV